MELLLKRILPSGIPAALEKADKYRELNQPEEAESICRDVLAIEPEHQLAMRILGLALTDRLDPSAGARFREAKELFARLQDPYERAYYSGLASERQGKAELTGNLSQAAIRPFFEEAFECYAEAERIRPPGNDDSILRWNSCVRTLEAAGMSIEVERDVAPDWSDTVFVPPGR
jgi:hypothetical protein